MTKRGVSALQPKRKRADKHNVARYTPNVNLSTLRGDLGGVVFRRDGVALTYTKPYDPKTPLQMSSRERMRIVADAWDLVTPLQAEGWRTYAKAIEASGMRSESGRPLRGYDLFCGLGCKYLQVHGGTSFPTTAPERPFFGDAVVVSVETVPGAVRFEANGPNGPFALTELLLQPLRRAANLPQVERYRTEAFVTFEADALSFEIDVKPGAYAAAIRYVLGSTGQATALIPLGVVLVSAA